MTKKELQQIMAIVRPAIIAMYGRQSFKVIKYRDRLAYQGKPLKSVILEIDGYIYDKLGDQYEFENTYRVEVEGGRVTSLSIGTLNLQ